MRMQKEEKIVVVLLLMALGSLAVAFWAFGPEAGEVDGSPDSVAEGLSGLSVEGLILEIAPTKSGGNLILRLDSTSMPVFIPANAGARDLIGELRVGERVRITGTVSEFQGRDELKISRAMDIQKL